VVFAERRHDYDPRRDIDINDLKAGDFENEPALARVNTRVVRGLANVAQALGALAEAREEEGDERRGGGFPLGARDGDDSIEIRVVEPQIQCRGNGDALSLEFENVGPASGNTGALEDNVARGECFYATAISHENLVAHAFGVVDDHEIGDATQASHGSATFDAVSEDADASTCEVSEASGPEHD
jgi:hypothetical protein